MTKLPKREPYERQFLKLIAKGMKILIEERMEEEKKAESKRDKKKIVS